MSVIYIVPPLTLFFAGGFVVAFTWATRNGPFDDTKTPPVRILFDEDSSPKQR